MLGRSWLAIWVHSNSLIKNLTPFEDDTEICWLNFLMQSICKQPEDSFIKMASLKIDFYSEVFKQLKPCFELSHRSKIAWRQWNLLKLTAIFIASLKKKTYLAFSSSYQWVDFFVNLLAHRKAVDSTPKYSLLAWDTNPTSIFVLA